MAVSAGLSNVKSCLAPLRYILLAIWSVFISFNCGILTPMILSWLATFGYPFKCYERGRKYNEICNNSTRTNMNRSDTNTILRQIIIWPMQESTANFLITFESVHQVNNCNIFYLYYIIVIKLITLYLIIVVPYNFRTYERKLQQP